VWLALDPETLPDSAAVIEEARAAFQSWRATKTQPISNVKSDDMLKCDNDH
jgi:hypothetical protein